MTKPDHIESVARAADVRTPQDLQDLLEAARAAQARQDLERAELLARLAAQIYPQAAPARIILADVLESRGREKEAIPELLRVLELDADHQPTRWKLALL